MPQCEWLPYEHPVDERPVNYRPWHKNCVQTPSYLGEVRTGVEAKVNNNLSLWGNVGVQLGDKGYSDTQGMLGVKYSW